MGAPYVSLSDMLLCALTDRHLQRKIVRKEILRCSRMDQINSRNSEGAVQLLVWAIEEIAKIGNKEAEHYARLALKFLMPPDAEPTNF